MKYKILEVADKNLLKRFIKFPLSLYKRDPCYVPHLFLERILFFNENLNPFFKHAEVKNFLIFDEKDNVCGRISGILNFTHNEFHNENIGFFGNFDCINDFEVSKILFDKVSEFLKDKNVDAIRGPVNFSTNDECGLLIKGFDIPPKIMMTHNYPYYAELIENYGFVKAKDLYAFMLDTEKMDMARFQKAAELLEKRYKVTVRKVNFSNFKDELKVLYKIYNSAWEKNWGFVPMNEEEFYHSSGFLKYIADRDLILIAEINNEPIGFIVALPDINKILIELKGKLFPFGIFKLFFNKKNIKELRIITLGIVDKYRNKGLDYMLIAKVVENSVKKGIRFGECSWILEDNHKMNNALINLGGELYKIYRIYERKI